MVCYGFDGRWNYENPFADDDEELRELKQRLRRAQIEDEKRRIRKQLRELNGGLWL